MPPGYTAGVSGSSKEIGRTINGFSIAFRSRSSSCTSCWRRSSNRSSIR